MLRAKLPFFLVYAKATRQPIFIEYIESDGVQWINTEYIMTSDNQEVECEFQYTDQSGTQCLFGTLPGANRGITPYTNNDSNFYVHTGQPAILKFTNFDYSAKHSLYVKAVVGQGAYGKLDSVEQTTTTVLDTINKSNSYFLFARNNGSNNKPDISFFKGRIYRFKMKDNGVVVRDLIPCLHPQTFEACMYDTVTKQYFYNQGTGSFIPAPRFVEYIESDGNQYIDTGLIGNFNTKAEVKFAISNLVGYPAVFGARETATSKAFNVWGRTSGGYIGANISNKGAVYSNVVLSVGTEYTVSLSNNQLVVNDNIRTFTGVIDFTTPTTMLLFDIDGGGTHTGTGSNRPLDGRVYRLKVWENNELIQDLRPALDYNNVACMYDMVTGKYFYNQGTGTFGYGKTISA